MRQQITSGNASVLVMPCAMYLQCPAKRMGENMKLAKIARIVWAVHLLFFASLSAQTKRPITARDCVTVRNLTWEEWCCSPIRISPDESRVAYLVRSPNLDTNENEISLYVRKLPENPTNSGRPILVGNISMPRWLADGKHLAILMREHGKQVIESVDVLSGQREILVQADADIREYSIDANGSTIVYTYDVQPGSAKNGLSPQEIARGYRIPFQGPGGDVSWPSGRVFVTRRVNTAWGAAEPVTIKSPLSQLPVALFAHAENGGLGLSVSPDGTHLLLRYMDFSEEMPLEWRNSTAMQYRGTAGIIQSFDPLILVDLSDGRSSVPIKSAWNWSTAQWSVDSKSFVVAASSPVGSTFEREDVEAHSSGQPPTHLFWVELSADRVEEIATKLAYHHEGALFWDKNGDLLVRSPTIETITRFSHKGEKWAEVSSFHIPIQVGTDLAVSENYVVGEFSDTLTPPELFLYRPGQKDVQVFAKLNPEFDDLALAQPREVHWKTLTGFDATGILLLPPGYIEGRQYPLVIHTKGFARQFVCGFGDFPSFSPQPLAGAGIAYLGPVGSKNSTQREEDYFPKGYPGYQGAGGIGEAAFNVDLWDSAVKALQAQGLVDADRVGIIGFSRTGWYTEFILAHSKIQYRAATVADNVQYSVGEYWLAHDAGTMRAYDNTYGGPPYGATLKNWLEYSVSFNLDKIHTPLLMEEMGHGISATVNPQAPPIDLAASYEVFSGLSRLNKPVELYFYPNEGHTPEHPQARLATMQRNVDWFRFWLQGYQRPNPEDPDQYKRWEHLRELQDAGMK